MNFKEFKPSSWAINNKISIYVLTIIITFWGIANYNSIPKESFPDIVVPTIFIQTVYYGNSPANIENLVTKPIEKQLKGIAGVRKLNSTSLQDVSVIMVEFSTSMNVPQAKEKVKDAVDKAATDLPKDLTRQPNVAEVAFSEMPIMYLNVAGKMDLNKLKKYADELKDRIETLKQISRVQMVGDLEREIQINVDIYKMQAGNFSMDDIERAVKFENMNISGGLVPMDGMKRNLTIRGEFTKVSQIADLLVTSGSGARAYLKDIAEVIDATKEQESYARLEGKNVITLNIIKRSGENLIEASDNISAIIEDMKTNVFPAGMKVTVTGDQSEKTRGTLHDLINTIIIGFLLVTFVLMFFMGVTNALFVAASVPLSMLIAFIVMPMVGGALDFNYSMNMIVLFGFLLALGIVVDDAIVVIENTHRLFDNGKRKIEVAAKMAVGEVFLPVLSGTLTTLAPFVPLLFWSGIIGKFMFYLPVTLIISLLASLLVAYIINPVFAVDFMKAHDLNEQKPKWTSKTTGSLIAFILVSFLFHISGSHAIGNLVLLILVFFLWNKFYLFKIFGKFQTAVWPAVQGLYGRALLRFLKRPRTAILGVVLLFIFSSVFIIIRNPNVEFFPQGDPNFVYIYVKLPVGTDPAQTNKVMLQVEKKVDQVFKDSKLVKSIITNVTKGTTDPADQDQSDYPNRGKIAISFVDFKYRDGNSTMPYLEELQKMKWNIPGADIVVSKEQAGPPVSKPVNIEVRGDNFDELVQNSIRLKRHLDQQHIEGVAGIKSDFETIKPEIVFEIDRERANREGISTGVIGMEIRKAVFGAEVSKFRDENDQYPIQLRYKYDQRNNIEALRNLKITFRDMNMGGILRSVPLSAFAEVKYSNTYGSIKRKMQKRVITLSSDVTAPYSKNPNEVVGRVTKSLAGFIPSGDVEVALTGQQEEQKEAGEFLVRALIISFGLMFFILVLQFNAVGKPIIILSEILFSIIGVFLGIGIFKMGVSIIMTMVGIIALGGVVVRNGILLIEFAEMARKNGMSLYNATVEAGRTRMTPVVLTATAAILGLIPLAVGLNIDFESLLATGDPQLYFGGDNVVFWGPLSWTMIFGLGFATFLTLLLVPAMYLISERTKRKAVIILDHFQLSHAWMYFPFFLLFAKAFLKIKGKTLEYGDTDY